MKSLQADSRIQSCWATGGSLRFTLVSAPNTIKRVQSIYDANDAIISKR